MVPPAHGGDGGGPSASPPACADCSVPNQRGSRFRTRRRRSVGGLVVRHVIARTVRDSSSGARPAAGIMPGDPYTAAPPLRPFLEEVGAEVGLLRIGIRRRTGGSPKSPCTDAIDDVAKVLQRGSVTSSMPHVRTRSTTLLRWCIHSHPATSVAHDVDRSPRSPAGRSAPTTWKRHLGSERGRTISAASYVEALETAHAVARMARWWAPAGGGFDLLLTPTLPSRHRSSARSTAKA